MQSINMSQACKRIQFDKRNDKNLIMLTEYDIKMYNFVTDHMKVMYDYQSDFEEQPEFFVFNKDQDVCIIASPQDSLYVNMINS